MVEVSGSLVELASVHSLFNNKLSNMEYISMQMEQKTL